MHAVDASYITIHDSQSEKYTKFKLAATRVNVVRATLRARTAALGVTINMQKA